MYSKCALPAPGRLSQPRPAPASRRRGRRQQLRWERWGGVGRVGGWGGHAAGSDSQVAEAGAEAATDAHAAGRHPPRAAWPRRSVSDGGGSGLQA